MLHTGSPDGNPEKREESEMFCLGIKKCSSHDGRALKTCRWQWKITWKCLCVRSSGAYLHDS